MWRVTYPVAALRRACIRLSPTGLVLLLLFAVGAASESAQAQTKLSIPGTAVTASANDGNVPANVVDGNLATRWSASGDPQWIQFDLGGAKRVAYVKIAFYNGAARSSRFDIQASSNGTTWTNVRTGISSNGTTTALETFDFTDVESATHLRIVGHGNTVNAWNSYTEVEIWGGPVTTPQVAAPTFSPGGGSYASPQSVTLSTTTAGASIRYTTDGSTPTSTSGTLYTGPVTVAATATLRAIAFATGMTNSTVSSATYTIGGGGGSDEKLPVPASAVTASGHDGNVPANTVDGSLATRWSASGNGQWIAFDLGSNKRVGSIKVAFYNGSARTSTFDVETSLDGATFSPLRTGLTSALNTALQTFDLPDRDPVRHVRVVGRGNSVNAWNSYTEVEIWGGASNGGGGDTQAPTAPANLVVTGTTTSSVSLSWTASTDNVGVTGYQAFNGGASAGTPTGTTHTVTGLAPGTAYTFTVRARDAAGNVSGPSNSVTGTTQTGGGVGAPAKPIIQIVQGSPSYTVTWNKWSGTSGTSWQMFENGRLIHSAPIADAGNNVQSGSVTINGKTYGAYEYTVVLTNSSGSTTSDPASTIIGGASRVMLREADPDRQALQVTINQGAIEYTLATLGASAPSYTVATNNSTVVTPQILTGGKVRITTHKEGRASVRITETSTGQTRFVGVRVRTSTGALPGLPNYVSVGSVSEDSVGDLDFWKAFDPGLKNRRMDIRYIYINGGPINGWRTWNQPEGWRAISYIRESMKLGMIPFFVYYNIPDGSESYELDRQHLADASYMAAYFRDLKFFLDIARNEAGDELVGIVLEPDLIGYMAQNSPVPPSQIPARVDQIYSTGVLGAGDPSFPNTFVGYVNAVNYAIRKHYPKAYFGWQFNLWASRNQPSTGIIRATDSMGISAGRTHIANTARDIANYYASCGILSSNADFISIDKYGLDAGISNPGNPSQSIWFWNADHWNNYLLFSKTLGDTTAKPVILWQIPVGHINSSTLANPYTGGTFPNLPNTEQRYEDSSPTFFLGDTFAPGAGSRFTWFSTNQGGDPKVTTSGGNITWGSHMSDAAASRIVAVLFGAGVGSSTDGVGSPPTDSYWWITAVQKYYQNPAPR